MDRGDCGGRIPPETPAPRGSVPYFVDAAAANTTITHSRQRAGRVQSRYLHLSWTKWYGCRLDPTTASSTADGGGCRSLAGRSSRKKSAVAAGKWGTREGTTLCTLLTALHRIHPHPRCPIIVSCALPRALFPNATGAKTLQLHTSHHSWAKHLWIEETIEVEYNQGIRITLTCAFSWLPYLLDATSTQLLQRCNYTFLP